MMFNQGLLSQALYEQQQPMPMMGGGVISQAYNQAVQPQALGQPSLNPYMSGTPQYSIGGQTFGGSNPQVQANTLPITNQVSQLQTMFGGQQPLATQQQGNFTPYGITNRPNQMLGFSRFPDYQQQGFGRNRDNSPEYQNFLNKLQQMNYYGNNRQNQPMGGINPNIVNPIRPLQQAYNTIKPQFMK